MGFAFRGLKALFVMLRPTGSSSPGVAQSVVLVLFVSGHACQREDIHDQHIMRDIRLGWAEPYLKVEGCSGKL